jgi:hypothetical protein
MSESINQVALALELLVTFAGVFLAFMLDRLIDWARDQKAKQYLLRNLVYELNKVKNNLAGEPTRLYHDAYDSAVASGKLNLLTSEQVIKIVGVYLKIRSSNYGAIRARIAKEAFERDRNSTTETEHHLRDNEYNSTKQETSKMIAALLEEPWLSRHA